MEVSHIKIYINMKKPPIFAEGLSVGDKASMNITSLSNS